MPKLKTHKGMKKRFKVSANGKVQHKRCGSSHLNSHKSGKRVRRLRKPTALTVAAETRRVRSALHIRPGVNPLDVEAGRLAALAEKAGTSAGAAGTGDPAPKSD
jgi:large subunit ribosomal protein L35